MCLVEGGVVLESDNEDLFLELELSDLKVNGESIADEDEDFLTTYGVVLSNPEDAVDDEELTVEIPEEQLTGSLLVN